MSEDDLQEGMVKRSCWAKFCGGLAAAGAAGLAAYALWIRPWHLRWGATDEEVAQPLPGDDLVPQPTMESTRAIAIQAPATTVWAWLVQLGLGRGGYYSYDWLENLMGLDIHTAGGIVPELQHMAVGDIVKTDPGGGFTVAAIEPARLLLFRAHMDALTGRHLDLDTPLQGSEFQGTWVFALRPLGAGSTRLVTRLRMQFLPRPAYRLLARALLEPIIFVMEQRMLRGIRSRAERQREGAAASITR